MSTPGGAIMTDVVFMSLLVKYLNIRFKLNDRRGDEGGGRYREDGTAGQMVSGSGSKQVGSDRSSD